VKKIFWIVLLFGISCNLMALQIISRQELGLAPFKIEKAQNKESTYYIVLLKGDSELLVLDSTFKPLRFLEDSENEGINDFVLKDEKLYCFGFFSGRVVVYDISGNPSRWKLETKISTGERLITGAFLKNTLGILGMDKNFLLLNIENFEITKKIELPVEALSVIADSKFFYISLFYNYNLLNNDFDTSYGLFVIDPAGKIHKKIALGKRPSYMLQDSDNLYVVNYLDGTLDVISKENFQKKREYKLGKLPNFPIMNDREIWVACIGSNAVYQIELDTDVVHQFKTQGSGPLKVLIAGKHRYVMSVTSGTIEMLDSPESKALKLYGYPIDAVANNDKIAVLLQEDWLSGSVLGSLVILQQ